MQQTEIYEQLSRETLEGRELEASVLFRGAWKLRQCARNWETGDKVEFQQKLTEALQFNQRLWSLLQVDLCSPGNPHPETLRMNLLRLSKFIDKQIFILSSGGGTPEDLGSIASVNEQIAAGLQNTPTAAADEEEEMALSSAKTLDFVG
jgi:flagellar protein FlaF